MYSDTTPQFGDSENNLLGKILEVLGGLAQPGDSDVDLLFRILTQLNDVDLSGASDLFVLKTGSTMTGALAIAGSANTVQLKVTGNSTQTSNLFEAWKQGETSGLTLDNNGSIAQFSYLANTSSNCRHDLNRRGTTGDINAALANASAIGDIRFLGWDGSAYGVAGIFRWVTSEAWNTGAHGSQLQLFATTPATTSNINVAKLDTTALDVVNGCVYKVSGTQVVSTRKTGWTAATGTATRTTFATTTVTTEVLAQHVKALIDDLISHGLIGT